MTINKTKVHSLINRSVWDYQPYYVDKNSLDHEAIKDADRLESTTIINQ
jgi:hypothetical protein